jgi:hypothetical protein
MKRLHFVCLRPRSDTESIQFTKSTHCAGLLMRMRPAVISYKLHYIVYNRILYICVSWGYARLG